MQQQRVSTGSFVHIGGKPGCGHPDRGPQQALNVRDSQRPERNPLDSDPPRRVREQLNEPVIDLVIVAHRDHHAAPHLAAQDPSNGEKDVRFAPVQILEHQHTAALPQDLAERSDHPVEELVGLDIALQPSVRPATEQRRDHIAMATERIRQH